MTICIRGMPDGSERYIKKPIPVRAIQMDERFEIATMEACTLYGNAGDYLIEEINGELYPCAEEIFEKSYCSIEDHMEHYADEKKELEERCTPGELTWLLRGNEKGK